MKRFEKILYVADKSVDQAPALNQVVSLAKTHQASLTVIDVVPEFTSDMELPEEWKYFESLDLVEKILKERRSVLEALIEPYRSQVNIRCQHARGVSFVEVIRSVLRDGHDLVVKVAENPPWLKRLFGSGDMHLLRKCPCPVWMLKPSEQGHYRSVIAAVDFDPLKRTAVERQLNREILDAASSVAVASHADLHVVHLWDAPAEGKVRAWSDDPDKALEAYVQSILSRHREGMETLRHDLEEILGRETYEFLSPSFHLRRGMPSRAIPEMTNQLQADLVVMGTLGRTGIPGLFIGNTAESVLDQLQCSVLAIKPPGFQSPIKLET